MTTETLVLAGTAFIVFGVLLVVTGMLAASLGGQGQDGPNVRGGGVVFLGPIPIVFGTDRNTTVTVAVLALLLIVVYWVFFHR